MSTIAASRELRRELARINARLPIYLESIPRDYWPQHRGVSSDHQPVAVWRSRHFLVSQYRAPSPAVARLSINRTTLDGTRWADGITWDDLQRLKCEAGFGDVWAVEAYPPTREVVNVANIRHLWLLPDAPAYVWRKAAP
jgi:hypothetical protein